MTEHRIRAVAGEDRFVLSTKRVKGVCFDGVVELFPQTKELKEFTFVLSTERPAHHALFYTLIRIMGNRVDWWVIEERIGDDADESPWADDVDAWFDRNLKRGTWYMWIEE